MWGLGGGMGDWVGDGMLAGGGSENLKILLKNMRGGLILKEKSL